LRRGNRVWRSGGKHKKKGDDRAIKHLRALTLGLGNFDSFQKYLLVRRSMAGRVAVNQISNAL